MLSQAVDLFSPQIKEVRNVCLLIKTASNSFIFQKELEFCRIPFF